MADITCPNCIGCANLGKRDACWRRAATKREKQILHNVAVLRAFPIDQWIPHLIPVTPRIEGSS